MKLYIVIWAATLLALVATYWFYGWLVAVYGAGMFVSGFVTKKHSAHLKALASTMKGYSVSWWDA